MFKAKSVYDERCGENEALKAGFIASNGWLVKFMYRNSLSLRRRTTIAEKDPSHLTSKRVGYVLHLRGLSMKTNFLPDCIIAVDETTVWLGMVGSVTVNANSAKDVPLKSTGNEKSELAYAG